MNWHLHADLEVPFQPESRNASARVGVIDKTVNDEKGGAPLDVPFSLPSQLILFDENSVGIEVLPCFQVDPGSGFIGQQKSGQGSARFRVLPA
jgi:hypothetical protein